VILAVGLVFAGSQLVRGAHYLSHSLWTGWICLALALLARIWAPRPVATPASGGTHG
jgi:membrane-associated PAP2 superfamily phosphatase